MNEVNSKTISMVFGAGCIVFSLYLSVQLLLTLKDLFLQPEQLVIIDYLVGQFAQVDTGGIKAAFTSKGEAHEVTLSSAFATLLAVLLCFILIKPVLGLILGILNAGVRLVTLGGRN